LYSRNNFHAVQLRHNTCFLFERPLHDFNVTQHGGVVSDDETVRRGYLRSVDSVFGNAEFVSDGEGAIEAMERHPFDVVLLDIW
jgi:hypothetical protein